MMIVVVLTPAFLALLLELSPSDLSVAGGGGDLGFFTLGGAGTLTGLGNAMGLGGGGDCGRIAAGGGASAGGGGETAQRRGPV
jgi:hypothetical protein